MYGWTRWLVERQNQDHSRENDDETQGSGSWASLASGALFERAFKNHDPFRSTKVRGSIIGQDSERRKEQLSHDQTAQ